MNALDEFPLQMFNPLSGKCGRPIQHLSGTLYFSCVLPRRHEGECQRGGTCQAHGDYIGKECQYWPDCVGIGREFNR
jgi:hypothetical protein